MHLGRHTHGSAASCPDGHALLRGCSSLGKHSNMVLAQVRDLVYDVRQGWKGWEDRWAIGLHPQYVTIRVFDSETFFE